MQPIRVAVLAFEGVSLFHLSVPGMVFGIKPAPSGLPPYEVRYCTPTPGRIRSDQGIEIEVPDGLELMANADIVVVPAWNHPEHVAPIALTDALQQANASGAQVVGLCLGAFVLGDAGLLDGRRATTHWACRELFAQRFPKADFHPDVLYVDDGDVITSAGTVAAIDCCLNLVRQRHGADVANRVARLLVTPPHRQGGQAQYIEQPVQDVSQRGTPGCRATHRKMWGRRPVRDFGGSVDRLGVGIERAAAGPGGAVDQQDDLAVLLPRVFVTDSPLFVELELESLSLGHQLAALDLTRAGVAFGALEIVCKRRGGAKKGRGQSHRKGQGGSPGGGTEGDSLRHGALRIASVGPASQQNQCVRHGGLR